MRVQIYDLAGRSGDARPCNETGMLPGTRGTSVQKLLSIGLTLAGLVGALVIANDGARAHHSFSMVEDGSSMEIEGTVQEFRFINPHAFILVKVKGKDGRIETWTLEGQPTAMLEREGWNRLTLKPGDQIRATISPLRSGGTGGSWNPQELTFRNGKAVAVGR